MTCLSSCSITGDFSRSMYILRSVSSVTRTRPASSGPTKRHSLSVACSSLRSTNPASARALSSFSSAAGAFGLVDAGGGAGAASAGRAAGALRAAAAGAGACADEAGALTPPARTSASRSERVGRAPACAIRTSAISKTTPRSSSRRSRSRPRMPAPIIASRRAESTSAAIFCARSRNAPDIGTNPVSAPSIFISSTLRNIEVISPRASRSSKPCSCMARANASPCLASPCSNDCTTSSTASIPTRAVSVR